MDADITVLFTRSTRDKNDEANKKRERILPLLYNPPQEYLAHPEYGAYWQKYSTAWKDLLQRIAVLIGITAYTSIKVETKGGRHNNYDLDVSYYENDTVIRTISLEFKFGKRAITEQPQFLSLAVGFGLFQVLYDTYWYDKYLDLYLACDSGITEAKPSREDFIKLVKYNQSPHPFFTQLKAREPFFKVEKNAIVKQSIKEYLAEFAPTIDIAAFTQKLRATQKDKIFILLFNDVFHIDGFSDDELSNITYQGVKNNNVIQLRAAAAGATYNLLLRWRNHNGILNPAWQISVKRV